MSSFKTNSIKAWFLACRPKTLTGAAAPVLLAWALAWRFIKVAQIASQQLFDLLLGNDTGSENAFVAITNQAADDFEFSINGMSGMLSFSWLPALLCLFFALLMQIDANLVNDYFDGVKGRDTAERLGPERAVAQGWITPSAMRWGIGICTVLACLTGLPLIYWGGPWMIAIGVACVIFCFLYTTRLASLGLGDVLVILFFGIIPVCATYYILTGEIDWSVFLHALAMGLITDLLLIVNNYRDSEQDKKSGKRTLVVTIGAKASEWLYFVLGLLAIGIALFVISGGKPSWFMLFMLPTLALHIMNWQRMKDINHGRELNKVLGTTAANILLFALSLSLAIIIPFVFANGASLE